MELFHVVAEPVHQETGERIGDKQTYMTRYPCTHDQACTIVGKLTPRDGIRYRLIPGDNDVAVHVDHAPAWTLLPGWHVRTEQLAAEDADSTPNGPPMTWEDPDFEVTGFTGWNNDTCQG